MIDDPEEDAWKELEARTALALNRSRIKSVEDAFADWDHSHRPEQYNVELRAFKAGWVAGVRNEWAKERND